MNLEFKDCGRVSNNSYVQELLSKVKENIEIFEYLAKVFSNLKENHTESLKIIDKFIDNTFNNTRLSRTLDLESRQKMIDLLKCIYRDDQFGDIRASFLEAVVFTFGPFSSEPRVNVYVEPKIIDNQIIVGRTNNRCDNVFHIRDSRPIRFIECKAEILNYFPKTKPFGQISPQKRKQIRYFNRVHKYLTENFTEPEIFVISYNLDYEDSLKNVQDNWGFKFFKSFNPLELINLVKQHSN